MKTVTILMFMVSLVTSGTTYYVDFDAGSDANDGLTTSTPLKTLPGTRTTDGSAYIGTDWGPFNSGAKVPDNTTFKVKGGTTHDSTDGGYVWVGTGLWDLGSTNIVIETDTTWGSGNAVIDGTGMTVGIALLLVQIDGVTVRGLTIQDGETEGIQFKEKAGTSDAITNAAVFDCVLSNNGTSIATDSGGAGKGQINVRKAVGLTVSNCVLNGNQNYINGILLGDSGKTVTSAEILSCVSTNHRGDLTGNDTGSGFKVLNSQATFTDCTSRWNLKGWDCGEDTGGGAEIDVKLINGTAQDGAWGINFNSAGGTYAGAVKFYAVNCLVVSNYWAGMNCYAGPWSIYATHNAYIGNGWSNSVNQGASVICTSDTAVSTNNNPMLMVVRNCIFKGATGPSYLNTRYSTNFTELTLDSDWNAYQQNATEDFAKWSYFISAGPPYDFEYGTNGAGWASGYWYEWNGGDAVPATYGTGHAGSDANSIGTGAEDTTFPTLTDTYRSTTSIAGANLSGESWFISQMGVDRSGRTRHTWNLGPWEFGTVTTAVSATVGTLTQP